MKFWNTRAIFERLPNAHKHAIRAMLQQQLHPGDAIMNDAKSVAIGVPAITNMVTVSTVGSATFREYLTMPSAQDFAALERHGFMARGDDFGFMVDMRH